MKQILPLITLIGFTALIATSCKEKTDPQKKDQSFQLSAAMKKMIALDTVRNSYINEALTLTGEVAFDENTIHKIFPRSSGMILESNVTVGDRIHAGQVLAVVKSADIAGNYADISTAEADIRIAKRQLDNAESLYQSGLTSERAYAEAKQNYEKALVVRKKLEATLAINGGRNTAASGTYTLVSPSDGYLVEKKVNAGIFIRPDMGESMFTVSDLKTVWVYANVFEADIPKVKPGYEVSVTTLAYPDKVMKGTIEHVSELLDPTNKTMKVRIRLRNDDLLLRPEMFAKVIVSNQEGMKAIRIPTRALLSLNGKDYVVRYRSDKDMDIAEVHILKTVGDETYLRSGVQVGDLLITKNQLLVFQELLKQ